MKCNRIIRAVSIKIQPLRYCRVVRNLSAIERDGIISIQHIPGIPVRILLRESTIPRQIASCAEIIALTFAVVVLTGVSEGICVVGAIRRCTESVFVGITTHNIPALVEERRCVSVGVALIAVFRSVLIALENTQAVIRRKTGQQIFGQRRIDVHEVIPVPQILLFVSVCKRFGAACVLCAYALNNPNASFVHAS